MRKNLRKSLYRRIFANAACVKRLLRGGSSLAGEISHHHKHQKYVGIFPNRNLSYPFSAVSHLHKIFIFCKHSRSTD
jgi:hypothetical protein